MNTKKVNDKLKNFKVLFIDADGVFFDGQETCTIQENGKILISKERSYNDGQGLSFLREIGIKIVFVTGEGEPLQSIVNKINNLPSVKEGRWSRVEIFTKQNSKGKKLETIKSWLKKNKLSLSDCAYIGDDLNDMKAMKEIQKVGLTVAPANGTRIAIPFANIITKKSGGKGAIREFAEMVLDARNIEEKNFPPA